jgi:hypothetical protein
MGAAARCVDVAIGSPIGQENNGRSTQERAGKPLIFPSWRHLQNGLFVHWRFIANYRIRTLRFLSQEQARRPCLMYSRSMPVRVGIMCEKCERIYLLVHPDNAQRIQFDPASDPHPYRLRCTCRAERHFDRTQILPYMVSERVCDSGRADRDEYYAVPNQKSK